MYGIRNRFVKSDFQNMWWNVCTVGRLQKYYLYFTSITIDWNEHRFQNTLKRENNVEDNILGEQSNSYIYLYNKYCVPNCESKCYFFYWTIISPWLQLQLKSKIIIRKLFPEKSCLQKLLNKNCLSTNLVKNFQRPLVPALLSVHKV